jgi:hypothetical protein
VNKKTKSSTERGAWNALVAHYQNVRELHLRTAQRTSEKIRVRTGPSGNRCEGVARQEVALQQKKNPKHEIRNSKQIPMIKKRKIPNELVFRIPSFGFRIWLMGVTNRLL